MIWIFSGQVLFATYILQDALDAAEAPYESYILPEGTYLTPSNHFSWVPYFDNEANLDHLLSLTK